MEDVLFNRMSSGIPEISSLQDCFSSQPANIFLLSKVLIIRL